MMNTPSFYNDIPKIILYDPLAEFLGAADKGIVEYGYIDAVKLAGHSCPTVAGAWLMTRKALASLYGDELPVRGAIQVSFRDGLADGVTGVIANVVGLITGAAQTGGFKGIGGKFERRNRLHFDAGIAGEIRYTRIDTGTSVETSYRPESVSPSPDMKELMQKAMMGVANEEERSRFGALWQDRVKRILIDHADDAELISAVISGS